MDEYGEDIREPFTQGFSVVLPVLEFHDPDTVLYTAITSQQARRLGLRLIALADTLTTENEEN